MRYISKILIGISCASAVVMPILNAQQTIQAGVVPGQQSAGIVPGQATVQKGVVPGQAVMPAQAVVPGQRGTSGVVTVQSGVIPSPVRTASPVRHVVPSERIVHVQSPVVRPTIVVSPTFTAAPTITLFPRAIGKKGNLVELTDGSIWKVERHERYKTRRWSYYDAIVVERSSFFFWDTYRLVNLNLGETVRVDPT
jgi:hypothetical protein